MKVRGEDSRNGSMRIEIDWFDVAKTRRKLEQLVGKDSPDAHFQADKILLEFFKENGMQEISEAYEKVIDSAGFWAFE